MQEPFNPYRTWLGFEPGREPANHYQLLGIREFEAEPEVIARAADTATSRIRGVRPGEHLAEWQQLLDHVKAVKACLLNPATKAEYDAFLRSLDSAPGDGSSGDGPAHEAGAPADGLSASPAPAEPVGATVSPSGGLEPVPVMSGVAKPRVTRRGVGRRRFWPQTLLRAGWLTALIVGVGLGLHVLRMKSQATYGGPVAQATAPSKVSEAESSPESPKPPRESEPPSVEAGRDGAVPAATPAATQPSEAAVAAETPAQEPESMPGQLQAPPAQPPISPSIPPQEAEGAEAAEGAEVAGPLPTEMAAAPVDPARQASYARELAAARRAMSDRDLATAKSRLDAAAPLAQTTEETAQVSRLRTVLAHLEEFWKAVEKSVAGLHSGQELIIQDTVIIVVEASPEQVVLRAQGRNYTYAIERLPHSVTLHLAEKWLADVPSSKVFLGTYLTVEPKGDRARAQQLLTEAAQAGLDVDDVLAELRVAPPSTGSSSGSAAPSTSAPAGSSAGKLPAPADEAALKQAASQIREIFRSDYAAANTPAGKASLAAKLLENAATLGDDPVARFAMLTEARDLAVEAGELKTAGKAVEQLGSFYEVDVLAMGVSVIEFASASVRGLEGQRELAQAALAGIPEAVKQGRLEEAGRLAELAEAAAVKTRNVALVRAARAAAEQVEAAAKRNQ